MLISPKHKFIFYKPMKCAGSSIEATLLEACDEDALCTGGVTVGRGPGEREYAHRNNVFVSGGFEVARFHSHTDPETFRKNIANPEIYSDYRHLTIVRNPWQQVISYYWWSLAANNYRKDYTPVSGDSIKSIREKFNRWLDIYGSYPSYEREGEFLWNTPIGYISEINEKFIKPVITDYIKFENIRRDFNEFCDSVNISGLELKNHKRSMKKLTIAPGDYFDTWANWKIKSKFKKTIERFDYKLGD